MALRPIGVNQLTGGSFYPLIRPPAGYSWLLADLWIDFVALAGNPRPPLRIKRLTGFGSGAAVELSNIDYSVAGEHGEAPIGNSQPLTPRTIVHPYALVIVDDNDDLVLDTETAAQFHVWSWGDAYQVLEWSHADQLGDTLHSLWVVRAVRHSGPRTSEDYPADYPEDVIFHPGIPIDPRAISSFSKRLSYLLIDRSHQNQPSTVIPSRPLELVAGYNTELTLETREDGSEPVLEINFRPGAGLGTYPTLCPGLTEGGSPLIADHVAKINGVRPTEKGLFRIETDTCLTAELLPYFSVSAGEDIDLSRDWIRNPGVFKNILAVRDRCSDCEYTCEGHAAIYMAIWKMTQRYLELWDLMQFLRSEYHHLRQRYLAQKACREKDILKLDGASICPCLATISVEFCNPTDECLRNVVIVVSFQYSDLENLGIAAFSNFTHATILPNSIFAGGFVDPKRGKHITREAYHLGGEWPNYLIHFPQINSYQQVFASWQLSFDDCQEAQIVEMVADVYELRQQTTIPHYVLGGGPIGPEAYALRLVSRPTRAALSLSNNCPEIIDRFDQDRPPPRRCVPDAECLEFGVVSIRLEGAVTSLPELLPLNGSYVLVKGPSGALPPCSWSWTQAGIHIEVLLSYTASTIHTSKVFVKVMCGGVVVWFFGQPFCADTARLTLVKTAENRPYPPEQLDLQNYSAVLYQTVQPKYR